ncbi:sensor histidine kinase [Streptomyces sp. NPDC056652]|uniref:sensor histidine kinase n=1 Tax=Streptomyces sp. NPDC056652 TaxID=3345893 RepID=UPI00368D712D
MRDTTGGAPSAVGQAAVGQAAWGRAATGRAAARQIAAAAFTALRDDLVRHALARRPLPALSESPALDRARRPLPRGLRDAVRWAPHLAVCAVAVLAMAARSWVSPFTGMAAGLLVGIPVALTLLMPVAAWWLTLLSCLAATVDLTGLGDLRPSVLFVTGPLVLVVCTLRLRPWAAVWMWLISAVVFVEFGALTGDGLRDSRLAFGIALVVAVLLSGWSRAGARASEQASAAEDERGRRARLEERTTIARELHDVVAHHMSAVAIQAEAAQYRVQDPPPELAEALAAVRGNAVAALAELRRVLGVIRADTPHNGLAGRALPPQPTLSGLGRLIDAVRVSGAPVAKTVTGNVRELAPGVELSAYRIVQEALSNAMRHAPGAEVRVELSYVATGLGVRVVNGSATQPAGASPGAGHGLLGMRERVAMLEGRLTARRTAGGGFEVSAFLPDVPPADGKEIGNGNNGNGNGNQDV